MKGSDILVKCLENEGVERIFGIPGEENLDLMDSLIDSDIQFVLTRHEGSAAFMAGMVGRLTSKPGVCLTTLGPGAANMVIGVGEAYLGYCPMVAMSGQLSRECQREPRKQYLDLMHMFRPITKGTISPISAEAIPEKTGEAFSLASRERPGPVFLELPEDVMKANYDGAPPLAAGSETGVARVSDMSGIRELIISSKRPIILAGSGVVRGRSSAELLRFAERWSIPTAMTWLGAGSVPFDHPLSLGTVGLRRADMMRAAFEAADLVILVGFDLMEFEPQYWNFGTAKKVAYIAAAPCNEVTGFRPDLQAIGDIGRSLAALDGSRSGEIWTSDLKRRLEDLLAAVPKEESGVKPQAIVRAMRNALGREDIAVSDVGAHLLWMAQRYPVYRENTLLMSNGLIPMGVGVPWAIAAKLTNPERKVIASVGDGSFAMTGMELMTAKELGTPFVTVVWNDSELALIRIKQEKAFGRGHGIAFSNPDIVRYAESLGATGYRAASSEELEETLARCLKGDELAVIDVQVDGRETARLTPS